MHLPSRLGEDALNLSGLSHCNDSKYRDRFLWLAAEGWRRFLNHGPGFACCTPVAIKTGIVVYPRLESFSLARIASLLRVIAQLREIAQLWRSICEGLRGVGSRTMVTIVQDSKAKEGERNGRF